MTSKHSQPSSYLLLTIVMLAFLCINLKVQACSCSTNCQYKTLGRNQYIYFEINSCDQEIVLSAFDVDMYSGEVDAFVSKANNLNQRYQNIGGDGVQCYNFNESPVILTRQSKSDGVWAVIECKSSSCSGNLGIELSCRSGSHPNVPLCSSYCSQAYDPIQCACENSCSGSQQKCSCPSRRRSISYLSPESLETTSKPGTNLTAIPGFLNDDRNSNLRNKNELIDVRNRSGVEHGRSPLPTCWSHCDDECAWHVDRTSCLIDCVCSGGCQGYYQQCTCDRYTTTTTNPYYSTTKKTSSGGVGFGLVDLIVVICVAVVVVVVIVIVCVVKCRKRNSNSVQYDNFDNDEKQLVTPDSGSYPSDHEMTYPSSQQQPDTAYPSSQQQPDTAYPSIQQQPDIAYPSSQQQPDIAYPPDTGYAPDSSYPPQQDHLNHFYPSPNDNLTSLSGSVSNGDQSEA